MADTLDLLLEAERRGMLPPEKQALLQEARARGMVAPTATAAAPQEPQRTAGEQLGRQAGLTARYGIEGPMGLINAAIGDPASLAINYGIKGINALIEQPRKLSSLITGKEDKGYQLPYLPMPSEVTKRGLDQVFPTPDGTAENVVGAISKGLAGGGPITAAAQRTAQATQAMVPMLRSIAQAPVTDFLSSGVGAGASQIAKEGGGNGLVQMAAGGLTPMALGGVNSAVKMAAQAPRELLRPVTKAGSEQIAADVLGKMTQDKARAIDNLSRYNTLVQRGEQVGSPGFKPTGAAVAADYGLAGGQQLIARGDANPLFGQRSAANNEALATDLGRLNATDKALEMYKAKRDAITAPLRDKAFAPQVTDGIEVQHHVELGPVAYKLGELAGTAAGGRAESQKALAWVAQRLENYNDAGRTDPRNAYALYQDIGDLVGGRVKDSNGSAMVLAGGLANDVKRELGNQIERAAPGFKDYLEHYSRLSKPIDRLEVIKDKLGGQDLSRVTNAMPQVTDNGATFTVSQAKLKNALDAINKETRLAPAQRDVLERALGGLNAESFASRAGKQPGSDTYQNLASANFMQRILGDTLGSSGLAKTVAGPLNMAFRPLEARINDQIVAAFQDPKKLEELLRKARTSRSGIPSLIGMADFSAPRLGGGLLGSFIQ